MDLNAASPPAHLPLWVYAASMAAIVLVLAVSLKPQRLRIGLLWVIPASLIAMTALALSLEPRPALPLILLEASAFLAGGALGWWQGQFTLITVEPVTYALKSRTSPIGMLVLLAVVGLRTGFRFWAVENASAFHLAVGQVSDALLLFAVGLVTFQRIEIAARGVQALNRARHEEVTRRVSPVRSAPSRRR